MQYRIGSTNHICLQEWLPINLHKKLFFTKQYRLQISLLIATDSFSDTVNDMDDMGLNRKNMTGKKPHLWNTTRIIKLLHSTVVVPSSF